MKARRHKHVRKVLSFYSNNFGFRPPYHVLVDGTFCKAALSAQVNIAEQLPKYLDAEVKLKTTKCVLRECQQLGALLYGPLKVLQQYTVEKCAHKAVSRQQTTENDNKTDANTLATDKNNAVESDPVALPSKCLSKLSRRQHKYKYIVATQDRELSDKIRSKPGIPLIYISHGAIMLESPSSHTQQSIDDKKLAQFAPTEKQAVTLKALKVEEFGEEVKDENTRKRKGPKGPNPLSCKKKKKKKVVEEPGGSKKKKNKTRKRHRRTKGSVGNVV